MKSKEKSIFWTSILITLIAGILGFIYPAFIVEDKMKPIAWRGFWWMVLFSIFWAVLWVFIWFWIFSAVGEGQATWSHIIF